METLKGILNSKVQQILEEAKVKKKDWRESISFEIEINGSKFKNMYSQNGNPWDCWLVKVGTLGRTKKTFLRIYAR